MRGPFIISLSLHVLAGLAMVWASGAGEGKLSALPSATTVHLIQPASMPATAGQIRENPPAGQPPASKPDMTFPDPATKKPKPENEDLASRETPKPQMPKPDQPARPGAGGTELKGDAGTLKVQGSGFGEYDFYLAVVQSKIERNFRPPPGIKAQQVATMSFSVVRSGQIVNVSKVKSSGNLLIDQAAERAVRAAGPFPPLPAKYTEGQVNFVFEFVINPLANR